MQGKLFMLCRRVWKSQPFHLPWYCTYRDAERLAKDKLMAFLSVSLNNGVEGSGGESPSMANQQLLQRQGVQNGFGQTHYRPPMQNAHHHYLQQENSVSVTSSPPPPTSTSGAVDISHYHPIPYTAPLSEMSYSNSMHPSHSSSVLSSSSSVVAPTTASPMIVSASSHTLMSESDLQDLSLEIEKERHEYLEKSKHLQEQLKTLKNEIEELKLDDKVSVLDQLHKEQQEQGDNKYSTIQKVKRGSMQSRVAYFEEL